MNALLCQFPNSSVDIEPFAVNFFEGLSIMVERRQNLNLADLSIFGRFLVGIQKIYIKTTTVAKWLEII